MSREWKWTSIKQSVLKAYIAGWRPNRIALLVNKDYALIYEWISDDRFQNVVAETLENLPAGWEVDAAWLSHEAERLKRRQRKEEMP